MRRLPTSMERVNLDGGIGKASRATAWVIRIHTCEGNAYGAMSACIRSRVSSTVDPFLCRQEPRQRLHCFLGLLSSVCLYRRG